MYPASDRFEMTDEGLTCTECQIAHVGEGPAIDEGPVCGSGWCSDSVLLCHNCGEPDGSCPCEPDAEQIGIRTVWEMAKLAGVLPGHAINEYRKRLGYEHEWQMRPGDYFALAAMLVKAAGSRRAA